MDVPGGHLTFTEKLIPWLGEYITYETTRYNYDKANGNIQGTPCLHVCVFDTKHQGSEKEDDNIIQRKT